MKKLNVLQSWRAFFILMVCIEHMALSGPISYLAGGGEGVSFFIVLSGFLTGYIYTDRITDYSFEAQKQFTLKKIKKFYPLHILSLLGALLLNVLIVVKNQGFPIEEIMALLGKTVLNATFLQVYIPVKSIYMNNINGVVWFLSTIVFCYANSIWAIKLIRKVTKKYLLFIGACIFHTFIIEMFRTSEARSYVLYVFPLFRFLEYFMGILAGYYFLHKKEKKPDFVRMSIVELLTVGLFVACHILLKMSYLEQWGNLQYYTMFWSSIILVVVFANQEGMVSKILNQPLLVYIGNISFEIYIIHQVIIKYVTTALGWGNLAAVVSGGFIITGAAILHKYANDVFKNIAEKSNNKNINTN